MERLTYKDEMGYHLKIEHEDADTVTPLGQYEETGLTPEMIVEMRADAEAMYTELKKLHELSQALKEDRLIVLPCAIGDTVYIIGQKYRAGRFEKWVNTGAFRFTDFEKLGKTVFLTYEEAAAALKEGVPHE